MSRINTYQEANSRKMISSSVFGRHFRKNMGIWWFLAVLASMPFCSGQKEPTPPSEITIRAGVLHAPPFASVVDNGDDTYEFGGLQVDLLERLKIFAAQDGVRLNVEMSPSPISYGDAFDLVANDCGTLEDSPNSPEDCDRFDLIVADYYANGDRSFRADLSPSWLRSTLSTVKYTAKSEGSIDVTTMQQAVAFQTPVCIVDGTYYARVLQQRFPDANWLFCPSQGVCLDILQKEECALYADDELQLRFRAANDATLEVTPEAFNTQYLVWASRFDMPGLPYLRKWIYDSVGNATMDELFYKYFQKELCPVGTAGESCELPCDPNTGEADESGVCVCISTKWTGDDCSIEVPEEANLVSGGLLAMAWAMLSVNIVTILGFGGWMYWQRESTQVRLSQPFFLCLILLGCLISSSTIGAMTQTDDGSYEDVPSCVVIPWLYSVGFSITFGTLFAKIRRVYLLFKSAAEMTNNKVTFQETVVVTAAVLALDVSILLVWTIVDPLKWERTVLRTDKFGDPLESEGHCTSEHWEWWIGSISLLHLALLGVACYMCYVSRDISTKFSEGKYVSIAMFSNLQIFVVGVPILIILGSDPEASFFVRTIIIWMNDFVVVTVIFGSLIYRVHFCKDIGEDKTAMNVVIQGAISKFSKVQQERRASTKFGDNSSRFQSNASSNHFDKSRAGSKFESDLDDLTEEKPEDLESEPPNSRRQLMAEEKKASSATSRNEGSRRSLENSIRSRKSFDASVHSKSARSKSGHSKSFDASGHSAQSKGSAMRTTWAGVSVCSGISGDEEPSSCYSTDLEDEKRSAAESPRQSARRSPRTKRGKEATKPHDDGADDSSQTFETVEDTLHQSTTHTTEGNLSAADKWIITSEVESLSDEEF